LKHTSDETITFQKGGFQTTYEELKPSAIAAAASDSGFQTTYEELKPSSALPPGSPGYSFQTTYEELKQKLKAELLANGGSFQTTLALTSFPYP